MAKKILCITADPDTRIDSFSSSVTRAFLDELRASQPENKITEMNLYDISMPFLDLNLIKKIEAMGPEKYEQWNRQKNKESEPFNQLLDQLLKADAFIFISRTTGFGIPAKMKALIEMLMITKYIEKLRCKQGIHIQIEDDMLAPIFPTDKQDDFRSFLVAQSVEMMDTLLLSHRHHPEAGEQENLPFKIIQDTRHTAEEYASFIYK